MYSKWALIFLLFLSLVACSSLKSKKAEPRFDPNDFGVSTSKDPNQKFNLVYSKKNYGQWIKHFTGRGKKVFEIHLSNASQVRTTVESILREEGLPTDLFYVGLIESGYNAKIKSTAKAAGHWQFMPATAKRYGLRVDHEVDERYSIYKSTKAAARYLKDLYAIFGSWELALCGYNAGEYRVIGAIQKSGSRDYRELVALGLLPKETLSYVPKVAAARELFESPKSYGLYYQKKSPQLFEKAVAKKMGGTVELKKLSRHLKVSHGDLLALNPDLKKGKTKNTTLYIPPHAETNYRGIASEKTSPSKEKKRYKIYVTKKKELLSWVAKRHGVSSKQLIRFNELKVGVNHEFKAGERLRIPL